MRESIKIVKNGLIDQNPTFVQLIGMCPTLGVTTAAENGVGMGLATTAVLVCSNVCISMLRKIVPSKIRIAVYVVVIAGFVSLVQMLMEGYMPALSGKLGLYIPLIVVNCIVLARAEAFASKNGVLHSALDGLGMGLGFTAALTTIGAVREIIGNGSVFGVSVGEWYRPAVMAVFPAGGFIILGLVIGGVRKAGNR